MTRMARRKSSISEDQITKIFNDADIDKDGFLSYREAKKAYKKVCKWQNKDVEEEVKQASFFPILQKAKS